MRKILIPIALAATLACSFAQAQESGRGGNRSTNAADRVDTRQAVQSDRIRGGVASGDLTRREATALRGEQRGIRQMERHARADGVVTPREGRRLEHAQDRASRHISQQRHDRQQRAGGWRGNNRGNHYAYGRGHDRGKHYAYGRGHDRGNHSAYGRGNNRGHQAAYGHRFQSRTQVAARGHYGRR